MTERDEIISSIIQQADALPEFPSKIIITEDMFITMMKEVSQVLIKPIVLNATLMILSNRNRIVESLKLEEKIDHRIREIQQFITLMEDPLIAETKLIDIQDAKNRIEELENLKKNGL